MKGQHSIEAGHRYREIGSGYLGKPRRIWIVEDTFINTVDGLQYVLLAAEDDPSMRKSISVGVLLDPGRFNRVSETR